MKITLLTQEEMEREDKIDNPLAYTEYHGGPIIAVGVRADDNTLIAMFLLINISAASYKAELGVHIYKQNTFLTKGIYKALIEFITESFKRLNLNRMEVRIQADNLRSISCVKKMGFTYEGTLRKSLLVCNEYKDIQIFSILRNEIERMWG